MAVVVMEAADVAAMIREAVRDELDERGVGAETKPAPDWLDADGVAEILGVTSRTVASLAKRGEIPASRVGRLWRFRRADVIAMLEPADAA